MWHLNGSKSSPHRIIKSMCDSGRLFNCLLCNTPVLICRYCDRGHQYCCHTCRNKARQNARKRASQKYAKSRKGKLNNAQRQKRFRERQRNKVTHQGSCLVVPRDEVVKPQKPQKMRPKMRYSLSSCRCHVCGRKCSDFFRRDFLHRSLPLSQRRPR